MCYFYFAKVQNNHSIFANGEVKEIKEVVFCEELREVRHYSYKQHALGPWCNVRHEQH